MADAEDLKSSGDFSSCGFDSHPGHHFSLLLSVVSRHFFCLSSRGQAGLESCARELLCSPPLPNRTAPTPWAFWRQCCSAARCLPLANSSLETCKRRAMTTARESRHFPPAIWIKR